MWHKSLMFLSCCGVVFLGMVSPASAGAQSTPTCPPSRNLVTVTVTSSVTFDSSTNLYTYRYTLANSASSQQAVSDFALDFAPPVSNVAGPTGWVEMPFHGRSTMVWDAGVGSPLPAGVDDVGQVTPPLAEIQPGSTLAGFSLQSPNPPGPVNYYALGFAALPAGETEQDAEALADNCPQSTGGFFDMATTGTTQGPVTFIPVQIEIKPGSSPAPINPGDEGVTPVAILSSASFDATTVDPASVKFGPAGATAQSGTGHIEDVNGDGRLDLVLQFTTEATGIACGDVSAALTGKTFSGTEIRGSGPIVTVGCKKQN